MIIQSTILGVVLLLIYAIPNSLEFSLLFTADLLLFQRPALVYHSLF